MFKFRKLRCSFCRRDENEVAKLVAGPRVYICDACVTVASGIINSETDDDNRPVRLTLMERVRRVVQDVIDRISGFRRFAGVRAQ